MEEAQHGRADYITSDCGGSVLVRQRAVLWNTAELERGAAPHLEQHGERVLLGAARLAEQC